jgi:glycosyltransferase involved in cell wall biosynthesis
MHVLRHIDRQDFQLDFLVHTTKPCAYDDEIRSIGSCIIPCLTPSSPFAYARNFKRILREYGPYDVVHSHVHHFSGYVLWLASLAGVPIRIAHSHSDTSTRQANVGLARRNYIHITSYLINRYATNKLAASEKAGVALFGGNWRNDLRARTLYCGIDFAPFRIAVDSTEVRNELGIPQEMFVIGHVGGFSVPKNHSFLVDVAVEVIKQKSDVLFLLVGDGHLRPQIEDKVIKLGLKDKFIFTGIRSDIPRLMKGAIHPYTRDCP